ncbi:P-loop containing nucleoside triphosphate hydrolase protein [Desarmillaria tabescens]|uniref:P-loop containing nucleoside triphosphate hydrolase protein n=1 Tax=Armillaria tabescens TaxID=1929756 RepID=A0AA39J940_ARMTA|nr:P-loop containing nucleoside triphosphate hydrolase protein [Desarmillaria tabescens]KAK0438308.1 P-loop containing nucleoside triphosphate hydrolase protein [Desarmillaria tabescens]
MLWLSRRPEWQWSREFETTTRSSSGFGRTADNSFGDEEDDADGDDIPGRVKTRVVFQPTFDTTHTIFYGGHWLRVKRGRKSDGTGCEVLSISVVARNNTILKQLVLEAKREFEAEAVHRIQIYFADFYGSWRWTDSRHKRPMGSIVLNPGVKEMLLNDTRDFLKSEKWYADHGIPFRRGYLLHGVPGSGKSSLIHAIAGELMLDIYVVSLSSSWISDSTLTTLMGRVPARCILLLEDLDAAFTRSVSRDKNSSGNPEGNSDGDNDQSDIPNGPPTASRSRRRQRDQLSEVNTLSLSGLLNALDGVAAAEGRLLFATTNHLERLDPALSRPGRMDVWIEFKNASKWQAEALFRNFFPSLEESASSKGSSTPSDSEDDELQGIDSPPQTPSPGSSTLWSLSPSFSSSSTSLSLSPKKNVNAKSRGRVLPQFGANNRAYLPPPIEEHIANTHHSAKPLDNVTLAFLAKKFADAIPQEEFSVAALQGYLLKHKSQPYRAANEAAEWVMNEREMKERLKTEKEKKEREDNEKKEKRKKAREEQVKKRQELELERSKREVKYRERDGGRVLGSVTTVTEEPFVAAVPTPLPEPTVISTVVADDDANESESDGEDEVVLPAPTQLVSPNDWTAWMSNPDWMSRPLPTEPGKWARH